MKILNPFSSGRGLVSAAYGNIVLGKFILLNEIGRGGMASVFHGVQLSLKRPVAIKQIHRHLVEKKEYISLFEKEAKILASVEHENIVRVIDYGRDDAGYYIIMNHVAGLSLQDLLKYNGALPLEIAAYIMISVLDALGSAHSKGVLHRDIKPSNILINEDGLVTLADFGIASLISEKDEQSKDKLWGSPSYMAPEVIIGGESAWTSDIYSLGIVFVEMLLGSQINQFISTVEIVSKAEKGILIDTNELQDFVPDKVIDIIKQMTNSEPAKRPKASKVISELVRYSRSNEGVLRKNEMKNFIDKTKSFWQDPNSEIDTNSSTERVNKIIEDSEKKIRQIKLKKVQRTAGVFLILLLLIPIYFLIYPWLPFGFETTITNENHTLLVTNKLGSKLWELQKEEVIKHPILIGNVIGNQKPEIIFGTQSTEDTLVADTHQDDGKIFIYSSSGTLLRELGPSRDDPFKVGIAKRETQPLILFDFNDDGKNEIVWLQKIPSKFPNAVTVQELMKDKNDDFFQRWWFHGDVIDVFARKNDKGAEIVVSSINNNLGPVHSICGLQVDLFENNCIYMTTPRDFVLDASCTSDKFRPTENWLIMLPFQKIPPLITSTSNSKIVMNYNGKSLLFDEHRNLYRVDNYTSDSLIENGDETSKFWILLQEINSRNYEYSVDGLLDSTEYNHLENLCKLAESIAPNPFYAIQPLLLKARLQREKHKSLECYERALANTSYHYLDSLPTKVDNYEAEFLNALGDDGNYDKLRNHFIKYTMER